MRLASWREAYAHILPGDFLANLQPHDLAERARGWMSKGLNYVVAELDGNIVGYGCWGANDLDQIAAEHQIFDLYVHPDSYGQGCGKAILKDVAQELMAKGFRRASISVFSENHRAKSFYDHLKSQVICESTYEVAGVPYPVQLRLWPDLRTLL